MTVAAAAHHHVTSGDGLALLGALVAVLFLVRGGKGKGQ